MATYRRPGVYLEESVLSGTPDIGTAASVTAFAGVASKGPTDSPVVVNSWSEYVTYFGGWEMPTGYDIAYLPYAVYSYFQNGGRVAYVIRAPETGSPAAASYTFNDTLGPDPIFTLTANSDGTWGNDLSAEVVYQDTDTVFTLIIYKDSVAIENFTNLSMGGSVPGTKDPIVAVNDPTFGSDYVVASAGTSAESPTAAAAAALTGGLDGTAVASGASLAAALKLGIGEIEDPVVGVIAPHVVTGGSYVGSGFSPESEFANDRTDVFFINDNMADRAAGDTEAEYATAIQADANIVAKGSSYVASYAPWIVVPDPANRGATRAIPPGGAVAGTYARNDAVRGIYRAPAGVNASLSNVLNVTANFSKSTQGTLNANNVNVIRPVTNSGICIMGARTRKMYGTDRYVNARRSLIYISESLKASTQWAIFENNDQGLWAALRSTAERFLRPIWTEGGLRGANADEAFYVICDDSINTPQVIAAGEVRMEVGVALEYPAEFVIIQLTQYEGGTTAEFA